MVLSGLSSLCFCIFGAGVVLVRESHHFKQSWFTFAFFRANEFFSIVYGTDRFFRKMRWGLIVLLSMPSSFCIVELSNDYYHSCAGAYFFCVCCSLCNLGIRWWRPGDHRSCERCICFGPQSAHYDGIRPLCSKTLLHHAGLSFPHRSTSQKSNKGESTPPLTPNLSPFFSVFFLFFSFLFFSFLFFSFLFFLTNLWVY